jgi:hypothetical protein
MQKRIIEICNKMAAEGIKPTLERIREELGSGSFSTINPILKQWKENRLSNHNVEPIELPTEIAAIGERATALIWKVANDQCNLMIKTIRDETNRLVEQSNAEREEALHEIKRLETEHERLNIKVAAQEVLIDDLKIKSAIAEKADTTITTLRAELEKSQTEKAILEGMLIAYKSMEHETKST